MIKSHQTAEVLLSRRPQTPVNISLLPELLRTYPNQDFDTKLSVGLSQCFRVGFQGNQSFRTAKTLPSAQQQLLHVLIKENLLEEVELGRLTGPFESPLFTILKSIPLRLSQKNRLKAGRKIAPNTGANATKFFTLVTKS